MEDKPQIFHGVEYYSIEPAARYIGLSTTGFRNKVNRYNQANPQSKIQKWSFPASRERFVKKTDLDKLLELSPVDE